MKSAARAKQTKHGAESDLIDPNQTLSQAGEKSINELE